MRKLFLTGFSAVAIGFSTATPVPAQSALPVPAAKMNDFPNFSKARFGALATPTRSKVRKDILPDRARKKEEMFQEIAGSLSGGGLPSIGLRARKLVDLERVGVRTARCLG
jgi:hypothetical protein